MLGKRIMAIRHQRGWTRRDLAEVTGLSIGYITEIERGRMKPKLKTLVIIAETLGIGIEELKASKKFDETP